MDNILVPQFSYQKVKHKQLSSRYSNLDQQLRLFQHAYGIQLDFLRQALRIFLTKSKKTPYMKQLAAAGFLYTNQSTLNISAKQMISQFDLNKRAFKKALQRLKLFNFQLRILPDNKNSLQDRFNKDRLLYRAEIMLQIYIPAILSHRYSIIKMQLSKKIQKLCNQLQKQWHKITLLTQIVQLIVIYKAISNVLNQNIRLTAYNRLLKQKNISTIRRQQLELVTRLINS